ncbi:hypothetical protein DXH95_03115 [Sphingorhabdus pulchriflava]|uniref:Uncharacterized protein n=1 Tax=Sphingorhabdus pulchriflava TaxID=2292257 RepID=A0A371BGE4_9SPHN|nr:hypothetical protein [Sphingorhabdus pulchriflava]RDV06431.1 hypothetical protein DXH95_03115 [Sphingorhabdus pulchriflava]
MGYWSAETWYVAIALWVGSLFCAIPVARSKNREEAVWLILCLIFGFVAYFFLLTLPNKDKPS